MWLKISTSQYTPPWIFDSPIVALNALWNCASYGWPRGLEQTSQVVFWWLKRRKRMFTMWPWWGSIRTCHHFVSQILDDFWLLSNCGIAAQYLLSNHIPWIFHVYLLSNHIPWIFHVTYSFPHMNTTHWYTVWFASLDRFHIFAKSIHNTDDIISIVSIVRNHVTTCRDPFAADFSLGLGRSVWNPFKIAQMVLLVHWSQGKHYGQLRQC